MNCCLTVLRTTLCRLADMTVLLPLTSTDLTLPDKELSELFLEKYVAAVAANLGYDTELIHPRFFAAAVAAINDFDVGNSRLASLEKALKKAAAGHFAAAASLIRSLAIEAGEAKEVAERLAEETAKNLRGPVAGGAATRKVKQINKAALDRRILKEIDKLAKAGHEDRYIAGIVAQNLNLSADHVRKVRRQNKTD